MVVDLLDLEEPIEVWQAAKGDRAALIALLRSDEPLSRQTRRAMADWLDGNLKPPKRPRGRPAQVHAQREMSRRIFGHDLYTAIGVAGWRHEKLRQFIRKKGWHRKRAGCLHWPAARLLEAVAERVGVDVEALAIYLKRSGAKLRAHNSTV